MELDVEKLMNLDIRLIAPSYRDPLNVNLLSNMAIFGLDNGQPTMIKVLGGWIIMDNFYKKNYPKYSIPIIEPQYSWDILRDIESRFKPEKVKIPQNIFRQIVGQFLERHAFARPAEDSTDLLRYLESKKDDNEPNRRPATEEYSSNLERTLEVEGQVRANPGLISLPSNPDQIYREVRIDNRLSKCIQVEEHYYKFINGDQTPNSCLYRADMIFRYGDDDLYIVELKCTQSKRSSKTRKAHEIKAQSQLMKASIFFRKNFKINPKLVGVTIARDDVRNGVSLNVKRYSPNGNRLIVVR